MNHSAAILIFLATIPVIPFFILAGALIGIAVAVELLWMWLTFVWEEM